MYTIPWALVLPLSLLLPYLSPFKPCCKPYTSLTLTSHAHAAAGQIAGIVFAIVGPTVVTILWLSITFSHRQEKAVVIKGVQQHIATSGITSSSAALIGSAQDAQYQQDREQIAKPALSLPLNIASDAHGVSPAGPEDAPQQSTNCSAFGTLSSMDLTASMGSSIGRSPSEIQGVRLLRGAAAIHKSWSTSTKEVLDSGLCFCIRSCVWFAFGLNLFSHTQVSASHSGTWQTLIRPGWHCPTPCFCAAQMLKHAPQQTLEYCIPS